MQPKPKHDETEPEHSKTPSPTEVADSSQGFEKPEDNAPTEVVDCTAFDYETWFEQNAAYRTDGNDDGSDDNFDDLATDEAAAITELMAQAAAQNVTMQVLVTNKRPRTEPESTEPAAPEEADFVH